MQKKRCRLGAFFNVIKNKNILKCPYDNCERTFKEKGNLKTHIRVHVKKILKIFFLI